MKNLKNAIDSSFQTCENGKLVLNTDYLLHSITLIIDNVELIYNKQKSKRVKSHSIVFEAMHYLFNDILKNEYYPLTKFDISTKQIEKYFNEYSLNYKEVLKPLIDEVEIYRNEELFN